MDGILYRPYLIPKIVAREKDLTRRVINLHPDRFVKCKEHQNCYVWDFNNFHVTIKPRYHIGQILFIREAHWRWGYWQIKDNKVAFKGTNLICFQEPHGVLKLSDKASVGWFKRSPLFLEAKHARHFIQITDIREERLQEITDEEAIREGFLADPITWGDCCHVDAFIRGWDIINPNYPFNSNPHVFRNEFKYLPDYKYEDEK